MSHKEKYYNQIATAVSSAFFTAWNLSLFGVADRAESSRIEVDPNSVDWKFLFKNVIRHSSDQKRAHHFNGAH